jgi:hypothetical protein
VTGSAMTLSFCVFLLGSIRTTLPASTQVEHPSNE